MTAMRLQSEKRHHVKPSALWCQSDQGSLPDKTRTFLPKQLLLTRASLNAGTYHRQWSNRLESLESDKGFGMVRLGHWSPIPRRGYPRGGLRIEKG